MKLSVVLRAGYSPSAAADLRCAVWLVAPREVAAPQLRYASHPIRVDAAPIRLLTCVRSRSQYVSHHRLRGHVPKDRSRALLGRRGDRRDRRHADTSRLAEKPAVVASDGHIPGVGGGGVIRTSPLPPRGRRQHGEDGSPFLACTGPRRTVAGERAAAPGGRHSTEPSCHACVFGSRVCALSVWSGEM